MSEKINNQTTVDLSLEERLTILAELLLEIVLEEEKDV